MNTSVRPTRISEYFVCYDIRRNACEYSCIDSVFAENANMAKEKALSEFLNRLDMPAYKAPHRFGTFVVRRDRAFKSYKFNSFVLQTNFAHFKFHKRGLYFVDRVGCVRFSEVGRDFLLRHGITFQSDNPV